MTISCLSFMHKVSPRNTRSVLSNCVGEHTHTCEPRLSFRYGSFPPRFPQVLFPGYLAFVSFRISFSASMPSDKESKLCLKMSFTLILNNNTPSGQSPGCEWLLSALKEMVPLSSGFNTSSRGDVSLFSHHCLLLKVGR